MQWNDESQKNNYTFCPISRRTTVSIVVNLLLCSGYIHFQTLKYILHQLSCIELNQNNFVYVHLFSELPYKLIKSRPATNIVGSDMNQTSDKEFSFKDSQIVWNYIFLMILFFAILLNNSLVLTAVWSQKRLQSQLNVIILASMALGKIYSEV
jgi:hypothetical protein